MTSRPQNLQTNLHTEALAGYRNFKRSLEAISELNQFLLRLDRNQSKEQERQP